MTSERSEALTCPSCQQVQADSSADFCQSCRFPLVVIAGKYRLELLLSEGGNSHVYLARHIRLKRNAERVIKLIKPEVFQRDPKMEDKFYREVQMTADLSSVCQHVVRVYDDFGEQDKLGHYYVMEYLQGDTLKQSIEDFGGPMPLDLAFHIFGQLCDAMFRAHQAGIVHRDLKPGNIMLIEFEGDLHYLKVFDFGIAKFFSDEHAQSAQFTQGAVGTPVYMAPEHFTGGAIDFRADLYGMGVILYEMLAGRPPFVRQNTQQSALIELMDYHLNAPVPSLRESNDEVSPALEAVVMQALEKAPEKRFQSALEFKQALLAANPSFVPRWGSHVGLSAVSVGEAAPNEDEKRESAPSESDTRSQPRASTGTGTAPLVKGLASATDEQEATAAEVGASEAGESVEEHSAALEKTEPAGADNAALGKTTDEFFPSLPTVKRPSAGFSLRLDNKLIEGAQITMDPAAVPFTADDIVKDDVLEADDLLEEDDEIIELPEGIEMIDEGESAPGEGGVALLSADDESDEQVEAFARTADDLEEDALPAPPFAEATKGVSTSPAAEVDANAPRKPTVQERFRGGSSQSEPTEPSLSLETDRLASLRDVAPDPSEADLFKDVPMIGGGSPFDTTITEPPFIPGLDAPNEHVEKIEISDAEEEASKEIQTADALSSDELLVDAEQLPSPFSPVEEEPATKVSSVTRSGLSFDGDVTPPGEIRAASSETSPALGLELLSDSSTVKSQTDELPLPQQETVKLPGFSTTAAFGQTSPYARPEAGEPSAENPLTEKIKRLAKTAFYRDPVELPEESASSEEPKAAEESDGEAASAALLSLASDSEVKEENPDKKNRSTAEFFAPGMYHEAVPIPDDLVEKVPPEETALLDATGLDTSFFDNPLTSPETEEVAAPSVSAEALAEGAQVAEASPLAMLRAPGAEAEAQATPSAEVSEVPAPTIEVEEEPLKLIRPPAPAPTEPPSQTFEPELSFDSAPPPPRARRPRPSNTPFLLMMLAGGLLLLLGGYLMLQ